MRLYGLLICLLIPLFFYGQRKDNYYKKNQAKLDNLHSGIGIEFIKPRLGNHVSIEKPWMGVNILSDIFEFKLAYGKMQLADYAEAEIPSFINGREALGRLMSFGVSIPVSALGLGAQRNQLLTFRAHPIINISLGEYKFNEYQWNYSSPLYFISFSPGYRLRFPMMSIDYSINASIGVNTGDKPGDYNWWVIAPTLTLRFDGLKQTLDPAIVYVPATQYTLENARTYTQSEIIRDYRSGGADKLRTTSYSSADVKVKNISVGLQDIGPFLGVGPRVNVTNIFSTTYTEPTFLTGLAIHYRQGLWMTGLNLEGGKTGHASALQKDGDEFKRKVDKDENFGSGTLQVFNGFADAGFDIAPFIASMLGVIREDDGKATTFSALTFGFSLGYSLVSDQSFKIPDNSSYYDLLDDPSFFNDPRQSSSGVLSGFFLGAEVGAVSFRVQGYKFRKAPLANKTMYSMIYRIPLI